MQTFAVIWLSGAAVMTLVYLILQFREYGGVLLFPFCTRLMLIFVLWPLLVVALACLLWGQRDRAEPSVTSTGASQLPPDSAHT